MFEEIEVLFGVDGYSNCEAEGVVESLAGATGASYTLTAADAGDYVYSLVTATNSGGKASGYGYTTQVVAAASSSRCVSRKPPASSRLRTRWRAAYVATLAPWAAAVAARPGPALDDFYLVNRAGRWSAAARQAYAIRSVLAQPFFDDQVVRAALALVR